MKLIIALMTGVVCVQQLRRLVESYQEAALLRACLPARPARPISGRLGDERRPESLAPHRSFLHGAAVSTGPSLPPRPCTPELPFGADVLNPELSMFGFITQSFTCPVSSQIPDSKTGS